MDELAQHLTTATLAIDKDELIRAFQQKMPGYDPAVVAQAIYDLLAQKPPTMHGQTLTLTIKDQTANLASYNLVGGNLTQTTITVVISHPLESSSAAKLKRGLPRRIISLIVVFIVLLIPLRASGQLDQQSSSISAQPPLQTPAQPMTGDVNIVIAEFTQLDQQLPNQWNDLLVQDLDNLCSDRHTHD